MTGDWIVERPLPHTAEQWLCRRSCPPLEPRLVGERVPDSLDAARFRDESLDSTAGRTRWPEHFGGRDINEALAANPGVLAHPKRHRGHERAADVCHYGTHLRVDALAHP